MALRTLQSLAELDRELDAADVAGKHSNAEYLRHLEGFVLDPVAVIGKLPKDPQSATYRQAQLALYEMVAKRGYGIENEATAFDCQHMLRWPFPYSSRSASTVGEYLMTYGNLIKTMDLPVHARILEIGSGYGPLTYQLASMGHSVTCFDMSQALLDYVKQRTLGLPGHVETILGDMNDLQIEGGFDAIIFFESFHHCSDHIGLLRKLPNLLEPGGMLVLAGEPIVPRGTLAVPYPWGLRLDGLSLWVMSRHGWLELGYEEGYLLGLLEELGWNVVRKPGGAVPAMSVWMAKRAIEDSPFSASQESAPLHVWSAGDALLHSQLCRAGAVPLRSNGHRGYLVYGPYVALGPGFFEVQWHGHAEPGSVVSVEVTCAGGTDIARAEVLQFSGSSSSDNPYLARLRFKVDRGAPDYEFRVRVDSETEVSITRVELRKC